MPSKERAQDWISTCRDLAHAALRDGDDPNDVVDRALDNISGWLANSEETGIRRLVNDVQRGGQVHIFVYNQASGPYCTVSGLGVHAGGHQTVEKAIEAWIEAREFDMKRRAS